MNKFNVLSSSYSEPTCSIYSRDLRWQPIFNKEGTMVGAECLHPKIKGCIETKIKELEKSGGIEKVDLNIFKTAVSQINRWSNSYRFLLERMFFSINMSPLTLVRSSNEIKNIFLSSGICDTKRKSIKIELIESTITEQVERDLPVCIEQLNDFGFGVSLDDFGKSGSSARRLIDGEFEMLKIDKHFISKLNDSKSEKLIRHIVDLSKGLGFEVIAEGVETSFQKIKLEKIGVNYFQGYYFSSPLITSEFERKFIPKNKKVVF